MIQAWHRGGVNVEGLTKAEDVLVKAKLDWTVGKYPVNFRTKQNELVEVQNRFVTVREDINAPLGTVSNRYSVLQNVEASKIFNAVIGSTEAQFYSAGTIGLGERMWILARLPGDIIVKGDDRVERYLLLSNSHDGSSAVEVAVTPIRFVCQNTLNMALNKATSYFSSRHTMSMMSNVSDIKESLGILNTHWTMFEQLSQKLVNSQANMAVVDKMLEDLGLGKEKRKESTRTENMMYEILARFDKGMGNDLPGVKGTAWALLNGVAEYVDYRDSNPDTRTKSILYGAGLDMKQKALNSILASI